MDFEKLFKTIDALMTVRDAVSGKRDTPADTPSAMETAPPAGGTPIEARLTNVLVAALKEAFARDHARLELERAHVEEQRRRAEETMRMEAIRHAGDREVSRLRLLAGAALVGWIVSMMLFVIRTGPIAAAPMILLAAASLVLLGSLGAAFSAQERVNACMAEAGRPPDAGAAGSAALWLLLAGLALSAASLLA
jgi:hypothetical protein